MIKNRIIWMLLLVLSSVNLIAQSTSSDEDKILGIWLIGNEKAKVQVYKCKDKYCGKIVWLRTPLEEDGSEKLDDENSDEALRKRPLLGLNLLMDFEYDDDLEWEDGEIYDPEEGKTYSCVINMDEDDHKTLNVRGYIGFSFIGRTGVWSRSSLD